MSKIFIYIIISEYTFKNIHIYQLIYLYVHYLYLYSTTLKRNHKAQGQRGPDCPLPSRTRRRLDGDPNRPLRSLGPVLPRRPGTTRDRVKGRSFKIQTVVPESQRRLHRAVVAMPHLARA